MDFTPWSSLGGGLLIGVAASLLWILGGRIAGISGIAAGLFPPARGEAGWRLAFLGGLIAAGTLGLLWFPERFAATLPRSPAALIAAGLLVGVGSRLGNGCTSGHGVCGLSRTSLRSLVAVLTFIGTGACTVLVVERIFGGRL